MCFINGRFLIFPDFSSQTQLFPTIYLFWQRYQKTVFEQIIGSNSEIVISGDGRHDSMGHNAKYGAYSIFCNTHPGVLHFEMIQVIMSACLFHAHLDTPFVILSLIYNYYYCRETKLEAVQGWNCWGFKRPWNT